MDNFESNNNNANALKKVGKALLYIIIITVLFVGGGVTYKYVFDGQYEKGNAGGDTTPVTVEMTPPETAYTPVPTQTTPPKTVNSPTPKAVAVATIQPTVKPKLSQRERVLDEMHKMANSKVIAEYVWGEIPVTQESVDKLITEVSSTTFPDRDRLLTILENWKRNDFTNAVNDHNYIWEQLGGTIGKATALKPQ